MGSSDIIAIPAHHRVRIKESKKRDKYFNFARENKKIQLWNMKVMVIPTVIGALGTILKWWVKRLEDLEIRRKVETIQTM